MGFGFIVSTFPLVFFYAFNITLNAHTHFEYVHFVKCPPVGGGTL